MCFQCKIIKMYKACNSEIMIHMKIQYPNICLDFRSWLNCGNIHIQILSLSFKLECKLNHV